MLNPCMKYIKEYYFCIFCSNVINLIDQFIKFSLRNERGLPGNL